MTSLTVNQPSHVFDETGVLAENFIQNEERDLAAMNIRAVIPLFGSFFTAGFAMRDANNAPVDPSKYQFGLYADVLSAKVGQDVAGCIVITDPTVVGPVYIDYHCVGGPWGVSNEYILNLFQQLNGDDRPVAWQNILGKPSAYVPAHHFQDIGDLFGAEYFVAALQRLTNALLMGDNSSHDAIFRRIDDDNTNMNAMLDSMQTQFNTQSAALQQQINDLQAYIDSQVSSVTDAINAMNQNLQDNYVSINQSITPSFRINAGQLQCYLNTDWVAVYPAQWSA